MGLLSKKEGYVTKGTRLLQENKVPESAKTVVEALNFYQNKIIKAMNGHPVTDTALVVVALRNLADNLEAQEPSCKGLVEWLNKTATKPELKSQKKVEKTKMR